MVSESGAVEICRSQRKLSQNGDGLRSETSLLCEACTGQYASGYHSSAAYSTLLIRAVFNSNKQWLYVMITLELGYIEMRIYSVLLYDAFYWLRSAFP